MDDNAPNSLARRRKTVSAAMRWAAGELPEDDASQLERTTNLPQEAAGGGPIYPELEQNVGGVIVYYAKNQKEELLQTVRERDAQGQSNRSKPGCRRSPPDEPMYLIISAGGGGGWAVNAYLPKETGVISLSPAGLLSVFGHEMAHTMSGPPNDRGEDSRRMAAWQSGRIPCGLVPGQSDCHVR